MFLATSARSATICHDRCLDHARAHPIDRYLARASGKKLRNGDTHDAHRTHTSPSEGWRLTNLTFHSAPLRGHRRCSLTAPSTRSSSRGPLPRRRRWGPRALSLSLRRPLRRPPYRRALLFRSRSLPSRYPPLLLLLLPPPPRRRDSLVVPRSR